MKTVSIVGAGPAGLAAALAVVERGGKARVYERRPDVGARFHGDFQGIENWTTEDDALGDLDALGIRRSFEHTAFLECVFYDPDGREHVCRSPEPLWYLVRRGSGGGTLDQALKDRAVAAGVDIAFGQTVEHLPEGGIAAVGPHRADAIAVGYTFETDLSDGAYAAVCDALAPRGYAYLLICGGRGTIASCMFDDFHNEKAYVERTVEFFQRKHSGLTLGGARRFGGFGNMSVPAVFRHGRLMHVGEAAGLQDALFGFGIRYALTSGYMAGHAAMSGGVDAYALEARRRFGPFVRAGAVNRYLYERGGARGYQTIVDRVCATTNPRAWLRRYYAGRWWTSVVYPLAVRHAGSRAAKSAEPMCLDDCDCTWCRCARETLAGGAHPRAGAALVGPG